MQPEFWWVWIVMGIILIGVEIITPGFIVMWFGVAAVIAALPVYLGASPEIVVATYAASLLLLSTFVRKITINLMSSNKSCIGTNADSVLGASGVITEEIDPTKGTGKARVGKEIWSAMSISGETIPIDSKVVVDRVEGVKILVHEE